MWDAEQNATAVQGYFLYPVIRWQKSLHRHMGISKHRPATPSAAGHNGNGYGNGHGNGNGSSATSIGQPPTDSDITARIKAALGALPDLIALRVGVDTQNGVVTLTRSVESRAQTEIAVVIAAKMAGVKYVNDHLIAAPPRRKTAVRMPGSARLLGDGGTHDG